MLFSDTALSTSRFISPSVTKANRSPILTLILIVNKTRLEVFEIGEYHLGNIYILFDGFTYNTRGYFASCVVFFRAPKGRGKIRAMSKMSASIICKTIE